MSGTIRDHGATINSGMGPEGLGGTVHAGGADISSGFGPTPDGTARPGGPDISSGHGPSPASAGISLKPGDPLLINNVTYQYEGVISKTTGEAEIFLLSQAGNKCVFKLYYPNFKPKEDIVKQMKQINHDDIINVIDYGYHHDRFFEIMDYAAGGTIEKFLPVKDVKKVKQIVAEVINAYKFCHGQGIIHKDIKPQNLYYKNADGTDILIGDFGISSLLDTGMSRHLTSQSLTVGYAAPEMYGVGGKVYVGKEVDYYALGITLIHIWEGKSPFDGFGIHAISNLTTSGKVHIPGDMPKEMQKLVKGLITVDYVKRWGHDEVWRWLDGEDVPVHFEIKEITYPPYQFGPNETATTAEELAAILKKKFDIGRKHLYSGKLAAWVNLFNQGLAVELDRIIEDDYPKDQDAGIQKAIYILDPDEAALSQRGNQFRTSEELADAFKNNFMYFSNELNNPNHPFYLYLEAHDAKNEADTFRKYFKTFSAKKALNKIILELEGRESLRFGDEMFFIPEELLKYKDQHFVVDELKDAESRISLWIEGTSFDLIKAQIEKWRKLDWCDEVTMQYCLKKGGPFGAESKNNADICYNLAYIFVSTDTQRTVRALQICLAAGEAYFIKIALDKNFRSISIEIYQLLLDYLNQHLSRKDHLINELRKSDFDHPLIKRGDQERRLLDLRMKTVDQELQRQIDSQVAELEAKSKNEQIAMFKKAQDAYHTKNENVYYFNGAAVLCSVFIICIGVYSHLEGINTAVPPFFKVFAYLSIITGIIGVFLGYGWGHVFGAVIGLLIGVAVTQLIGHVILIPISLADYRMLAIVFWLVFLGFFINRSRGYFKRRNESAEKDPSLLKCLADLSDSKDKLNNEIAVERTKLHEEHYRIISSLSNDALDKALNLQK